MVTIALMLPMLALSCLLCDSVAYSDEPKAARSIDLLGWKLTLPIDAEGKFSGNAAEIPPDRLAGGYAHADLFQVGSDGTLTFWAPVIGATTDNSDYPRSELREMLDATDESVNWRVGGSHVLTARCRVRQVPSSQKVIIGQIHSFTGKALPLVKLQFFKGRIEALVKRSPKRGGDLKLELAKADLDSDIAYEIRLDDGKLSITVNGHTQRVNILEGDPAWAEQTFYFKAGAYCQDNDGPPTEGARVTFSCLRATHSCESKNKMKDMTSLK